MPRKTKVQDQINSKIDAQRVEDAPPPKISLGRIVHYVTKKGAHRPAIVVEVWGDEVVNLQVFTDMRNDGELQPVQWATSVRYSDEKEELTWHWPER